MARVKITVFKRVDPAVIFDGKVPNKPGTNDPYVTCEAFKEGQEFIVEDSLAKPEGFCNWAWRDIFKDVSVMRFGGNFWPGWVEKGKMYSCCTDGIRPVSFFMERLED
jgi:uncharacterized repeat protein (TIGR04076 family)